MRQGVASLGYNSYTFAGACHAKHAAPFPVHPAEKAYTCRMEADTADRAGLQRAPCWLALQLLCSPSLPWAHSFRATLLALRYVALSLTLRHCTVIGAEADVMERAGLLLRWFQMNIMTRTGRVFEDTDTARRACVWHTASAR